MRRFSAWLLAWSERLYLSAHGWRQRAVLGEEIHGAYLIPDDYPFKDKGIYTRTHAINAQRQVAFHLRQRALTAPKDVA